MSKHTLNFIQTHILAGLTQEQALDKLTTELGISVKRYPEDNLVLLDYCQIESPKTHPVVIECRSLILALDTLQVVSRKFDRFFNIGENPAYYSDFDLSRGIVFNKEDGSLIGIYWNPHTERWEISTRGMALAEGQHPLGEGTFRDAVITALGLSGEAEFQENMYYIDHRFEVKEFTFVLEYCSHRNIIVTPYSCDQMFLLAVTTATGELPPSELVNCVRWFDCGDMSVTPASIHPVSGSAETLTAAVNELTGMAEGFVVYDPVSGKRAKIKNSTYVIAHQLRGNSPLPTRKNLLELVFNGNAAEFIAYFPVWRDMVNSIDQEVRDFLVELNCLYDENKHIENQKEFALAIKNGPGTGYLFKARKYNISPTTAFLGSELTTKQKTFGV